MFKWRNGLRKRERMKPANIEDRQLAVRRHDAVGAASERYCKVEALPMPNGADLPRGAYLRRALKSCLRNGSMALPSIQRSTTTRSFS